MLAPVLKYLDNKCPKCGGGLVAAHSKQLAQCAKCHTYGHNPKALLMQSGMNFLQAEAWINQNCPTAGHQTAVELPTVRYTRAVGFYQSESRK